MRAERTRETIPAAPYWPGLLTLAAAKLLLHFVTNTNYGLHRDEYLYLTQAEHLNWGYMEVPPVIAVIGRTARLLLGDTTFAARFFPALVGAISILLIGLMVRDMGGRKWAQILAGAAFLLSPAYLGSNTLFQPVSFNQFFWLLCAFWVVRILRYQDLKYWYYLGLSAGLGFLTKYSIVFFMLALAGGFLLSRHRHIFRTRHPWVSAGIALVIAVMLLLNAPIIPYALPVLPIEKMQAYADTMRRRFGLDAPLRWEDGSIRDLPQDYADMHGWEEIPEKVADFYHQLDPSEQAGCLILAGHYGQAGVMNFNRKRYQLPETYSLNSSFIMWAPENIEFDRIIQIDDQPQSNSRLFESVILIDSIENPYARDPGLIYYKTRPREDVKSVWKSLVRERRQAAGY